MPPKNKSKNAPNQHDKRHESGLAAPGKRVTKQRSSGQLNGQPNGRPSPSAITAPALPTTGLNQGFRFSRSADLPTSANDHSSTAPPPADHVGPHEGAARERISSDVSLEDFEFCGGSGDMAEAGHLAHDAGPPSLNFESASSAYPSLSPGYPTSPTSSVSTILINYPLRDAISILILLLSLPPTLVLVIQTLFTSLTFVPPTVGLSFSTFPNLKELFNSSGLGYPALATILIVDGLFWVCWLPLWSSLQNVLLDLSQAVIAVSLSGATAGNGRPTYAIATTSAIVCVVHVLRYKAVHLTALDYLRSVIHKAGGGLPVDVLSLAANYFSSSPNERGWTHTVIRTILGIHIVSQGVTTCIRRSLVRANEQSANVPSTTKTDPEATAGSDPGSRSASASHEAAQLLAVSSGPDGRFPGSSQAPRDSKSRESTSKKKRKQANQVRSQQPLWAAIASTKVTFVKEMEQKDAANDAREASLMGNRESSMSSPSATASLDTVTSRIWVREVRDSEIFFTVQLDAGAKDESARTGEEGVNVGAGIDKSKPFYVRINGAVWSSTRITPRISVHDAFRDDENETADIYDGEIFGLAPLSSYHCEVMGLVSRSSLCGAKIITQPAPPSAEPAAASSSLSSQPSHPTLRPSSPITTLKQSIQAAEVKLNEARNRGKKSKKDQRAVHTDVKREINTLRTKLDSSGGTDERQKSRLLQIGQHKNQAEEAAAELKMQVDAMGEIPASELAEAESLRELWTTAHASRTSAFKSLEESKFAADRELSNLQCEITQAESRREKLLARHAQRTQDMEKLVSKQHADMSAKQKRDFERAQLSQNRENEEKQIRGYIAHFENESHSFQQKAHEAYSQIAALQSWGGSSTSHSLQYHHAPPHSSHQPPPYSSPPTPETQNATINGSSSISPLLSHLPHPSTTGTNGFPTFTPGQPYSLGNGSSPFNHHATVAPPQPAPRQRSSSMLSAYSGFTDDDGADDPHPLTAATPTTTLSGQSQFPQDSSSSPHHAQTIAAARNNNPTALSHLVDDYYSHPERSGSLASGSTGSNSPRPDAKPFIPASSSITNVGGKQGVSGISVATTTPIVGAGAVGVIGGPVARGAGAGLMNGGGIGHANGHGSGLAKEKGAVPLSPLQTEARVDGVE